MILESPSKCVCGKPMPWHLFGVAGKGYTHHCCRIGGGGGCGRTWEWKSPKSCRLVDRSERGE